MNKDITLTLSTCWYKVKSKFDSSVYEKWIDNFLSMVNNFYLVIYTNLESVDVIKKYENKNIKIVIKPIDDFVNYKYKNKWIKNHEVNHSLNKTTSWELNMLWSEKVHFVNETYTQQYFITPYYGWCDIGYFRNTPYNLHTSDNIFPREDLHTSNLKNWPSSNVIMNLDKTKIYYGLVCDHDMTNKISNLINNRNEYNLPIVPIPTQLNIISGGFFICYKDKITWWVNQYDNRLLLYFKHNYLVKDDQIIITDCIFTNINHFQFCVDNANSQFNKWFVFQRFLL